MIRWLRNKRTADGTTVVQTIEAIWIVQSPEHEAVMVCPTCKRPMHNAETARTVADAISLPVAAKPAPRRLPLRRR